MEKKARAATETSVFLGIAGAIAVAVNILSFTTHARVDTTKNERFTLSKGSGRLVSNLKKPITVKAYVTVGLAKLDAFTRDLDDLMKEYERQGGGKFKYEKIIAKTDEQKNEAKEYGLKEAAFGEGSETGEDQASIAQGYMGLVFLYGDEKDNIPMLQPENVQGMEFWISNKIREIRDKADDNHRKVGILGGHDEIKLADANLVASEGGGRGGPSMRSVMEQAFPFYKFEDVDLKNGEAEVDEAIDALVITQPGKDFTDKELRRIDQYVMKGNKGLVVFASAVNMKPSDAKMTATLSTHGLEKLLGGYGVDMKKDAVLDWARSVRVPVPTQAGGTLSIRAPAIIQAQAGGGLDKEHTMLDQSFIGFFRIEELSFPFPSSLVVEKGKQPTAQIDVVARSTPAAWLETGESFDLGLKPDWKPKPPLDQRNIAISVQGKLKSAFGGGNAEGVEIAPEAKQDSRVLVVSSAQFLANPFARAGNGQALEGQMAMMMPAIGGDRGLQMIAGPYAQKYLTATILAFKNTLDWLTGDSDLVATSAKLLGDPNLTYSDVSKPKLEASDDEATIKAKDEAYRNQRKGVQRNVQLTLILLSPLAFAGFGLLRWQSRERKRSQKFLLSFPYLVFLFREKRLERGRLVRPTDRGGHRGLFLFCPPLGSFDRRRVFVLPAALRCADLVPCTRFVLEAPDGTVDRTQDLRRIGHSRRARRRRVHEPTEAEGRGEAVLARRCFGEPPRDQARGRGCRQAHEDHPAERRQDRHRPREEGRQVGADEAGRVRGEPGKRQVACR
jgi:hypothetical protein